MSWSITITVASWFSAYRRIAVVAHPLFHVEVRRGLVEKVQIGVFGETRRDGDALALPARQVREVLLHHAIELERLGDLRVPVGSYRSRR